MEHSGKAASGPQNSPISPPEQGPPLCDPAAQSLPLSETSSQTPFPSLSSLAIPAPAADTQSSTPPAAQSAPPCGAISDEQQPASKPESGQPPNTRSHEWEITIVKYEGWPDISRFVSITAMRPFVDYSLEELRLSDYTCGDKGGDSFPASKRNAGGLKAPWFRDGSGFTAGNFGQAGGTWFDPSANFKQWPEASPFGTRWQNLGEEFPNLGRFPSAFAQSGSAFGQSRSLFGDSSMFGESAPSLFGSKAGDPLAFKSSLLGQGQSQGGGLFGGSAAPQSPDPFKMKASALGGQGQSQGGGGLGGRAAGDTSQTQSLTGLMETFADELSNMGYALKTVDIQSKPCDMKKKWKFRIAVDEAEDDDSAT